ncbi:MAG: DoxX family protein [Myxococcales bacterium]|nr:DoxX family protein [Myxococcales bacterium]MCB9580155.1 DoxX family protein [Polyangiaceae bacterium]
MKIDWKRKGTTTAMTILRIAAGTIMVAHGVQKLADPGMFTQAFASFGIPLPGLAVWLAIAGELAGGLGLLLGFLTRIAALGPLCTMLVAIASVHLGNGLFAANNGWEYPLTMLLVALVFVFRGAGPVSVDAMLQKARDKSPDGELAMGHRPHYSH